MDRELPPSYPTVHVTMHANGIAQVNLAGDHQTFTGPTEAHTREQVIAYAAAAAERLRRGVRMRLVDASGTFDLAVYPDGAVQPITAPRTRRRKAAVAPRATPVPAPQPIAPPASMVQPPPVAPTPPAPAPTPQEPVAVLAFSTGDRLEIRGRVVIGRHGPGPAPETPEGWTRLEIDDATGTISRNHVAIQFSDGVLWISDLGTKNGTDLRRGAAPPMSIGLTPEQVLDADTIMLGTSVSATVTLGIEVPA